jgi:hypothetical protein
MRELMFGAAISLVYALTGVGISGFRMVSLPFSFMREESESGKSTQETQYWLEAII